MAPPRARPAGRAAAECPRVHQRQRRRPPLSGKRSTTQTSRRERRAAERRDRFDLAREERRIRATGSSTGSALLNTRNITVAAVVIGVLIVVFVAANQLGGKVTGTFNNPGISYPAAIQDGEALGSTSAPMTLDVYSDYQCPYCAQSVLSVEPLLVNQYVVPGKLRIVHHEVQWVGSGPNNESQTAMAGGYCANQQGKYWDYTVWVYANQDGENQGGFRPDRLTAIAEAAGVDTSTWSPCLTDAATIQAVNAQSVDGLQKLAGGTPTFYLDGVSQGSGVKTMSQWTTILDAELARLSASASPSPGAASPSTAP